MICNCVKRLSEFVIPGAAKTDNNLKTLALKNLALVEKNCKGIILRVEGLANELIKILDDKDFNLRLVDLEVLG